MLIEKDFIFGGTFKVTKNHDSYEMTYIKNRDGTTVMSDAYYIEIRNSKGLYDISFKEGVWKFKSDWGNGDIGEFVLYQKSKDLFEGWSYLRGEKRTLTRFFHKRYMIWINVMKLKDISDLYHITKCIRRIYYILLFYVKFNANS